MRDRSALSGSDPAHVVGASVTLCPRPGARTAWHTHPLGQTLIVTSGCGWAQRWADPSSRYDPAMWSGFLPSEKHWH